MVYSVLFFDIFCSMNSQNHFDVFTPPFHVLLCCALGVAVLLITVKAE